MLLNVTWNVWQLKILTCQIDLFEDLEFRQANLPHLFLLPETNSFCLPTLPFTYIFLSFNINKKSSHYRTKDLVKKIAIWANIKLLSIRFRLVVHSCMKIPNLNRSCLVISFLFEVKTVRMLHTSIKNKNNNPLLFVVSTGCVNCGTTQLTLNFEEISQRCVLI